jgi:CysZ protein
LLKEIIIAIQAYIQAHRFIKKHKLWKWIIVHGILYAILFVISFIFFFHISESLVETLILKTGLKNWLDKLQSSWLGFLFILGSFILMLVQLLLSFSLFKYFFLIVGAPLFAYLSEKTEAIIEGKDFPFSFLQLAKDIIRGIQIAVRNFLWQIVYSLAILFASLIPLAGLLVPVFALLLDCYFYGFSMLDYSMERHKKTASESIFFIANHKGLAIGNGIMFYCMHIIPIIGWILAPAYAVIAATLSMYPLKENN